MKELEATYRNKINLLRIVLWCNLFIILSTAYFIMSGDLAPSNLLLLALFIFCFKVTRDKLSISLATMKVIRYFTDDSYKEEFERIHGIDNNGKSSTP